MKEIYFCVDYESLKVICGEMDLNNGWLSHHYDSTEYAIVNSISPIVTTSLTHMSFSLLDLGYDIYLCKGDNRVKIEKYMLLSDGFIINSNDDDYTLLDYFLKGFFDEELTIKSKE